MCWIVSPQTGWSMCGTVFRNRGSEFPEQILPFFGAITARFVPSKSVCESRCLIEQGWGYPFGRTKNADPYLIFAWATLPPNGTFDLKYGSCGCNRPEAKQTDRRHKTKNCGNPFQRSPCLGYSFAETGCRTFYFQSLKMSSKALSNAVFILFSIMLIISASRMDCFFFFFFSLSRSLVD